LATSELFSNASTSSRSVVAMLTFETSSQRPFKKRRRR
jgi:hypothetical protein